MGQLEQCLVRDATESDVGDIASMREEVLGWDRRESYIMTAITTGHGVVAYGGGRLVGFRYQHALTPDTLGDGLLLVTPSLRAHGLGRAIVEAFERTADERWRMSVVLNTDLLASTTQKGPVTGFWIACGYRLAGSTGEPGGTRLLFKYLGPLSLPA